MLGRLRKRLTYANVVSTFTLFIVLGTGTAYATHLVVRSSDVVNGSLVSADLKNGLGVVGADVANHSLTGADIREGTLGQVPTATLGGLGRSAADSGCDPTTSAFVRCVEVALDLPSPARVLLNARITATKSQGTVGNAFGQCRWGGVVESGSLLVVPPSPGDGDISLVGLTGVLPAGQGFTFAVECSDDYNNVSYRDAWITAVAISPS